jgi:hypothetical protein
LEILSGLKGSGEVVTMKETVFGRLRTADLLLPDIPNHTEAAERMFF